MNQKASLKIVLILIIVLILGTVGYFILVKNSGNNVKDIALSLKDVKDYNYNLLADDYRPNLNEKPYPHILAWYIESFDTLADFSNLLNVNATAHKSLVNDVYLYDSLENAQKALPADHSQDFQKLAQQSFQIEKIGDESYAFSDSSHIVRIWFRKNSIISQIALTGGDINEAVKFAKLVESRIK